MIDGLIATGDLSRAGDSRAGDSDAAVQALAFSIALTDVDGFFDAYDAAYADQGGRYQYRYEEAAARFKGHLKAEVGFVPAAGEWVGLSLQGGAELAYEYIDYHYQGEWGEHSDRMAHLTRSFVPADTTLGLKLNDQQFSLAVVDQTEHSVDRFCGGDASLWQLTNQENVSLLLNISEACNFGKIALAGGDMRTLGTLEQRDGLWMIQFVDGTFETLF